MYSPPPPFLVRLVSGTCIVGIILAVSTGDIPGIIFYCIWGLLNDLAWVLWPESKSNTTINDDDRQSE